MPFDIASSPPVPAPDELARFYFEAAAQHRLELLRCQQCGHFVHYPRPVCNRCLSTSLAPEEVSGRGTLYSYSEIHQPSHPYFTARLPYLIGVIDVEEEPGVRIPTGIVDAVREDLRCGMPVQVVFHEVTPTLTLPYFRPTEEA